MVPTANPDDFFPGDVSFDVTSLIYELDFESIVDKEAGSELKWSSTESLKQGTSKSYRSLPQYTNSATMLRLSRIVRRNGIATFPLLYHSIHGQGDVAENRVGRRWVTHATVDRCCEITKSRIRREPVAVSF